MNLSFYRTEKIRSFKVGLEKVKQGDFIYLGDAAEIEYKIQSDCSLTQIGEVFNLVDNALAFRPGKVQMFSIKQKSFVCAQHNPAF